MQGCVHWWRAKGKVRAPLHATCTLCPLATNIIPCPGKDASYLPRWAARHLVFLAVTEIFPQRPMINVWCCEPKRQPTTYCARNFAVGCQAVRPFSFGALEI